MDVDRFSRQLFRPDQVAKDGHRLGGFLEEHGVLRIEVGSRQEVSRHDLVVGSRYLLPGPKVGVVSPDLPRDSHLRTAGKGDLPDVLAAHENLALRRSRCRCCRRRAALVRTRRRNQLGFPAVAKELDAFRIGRFVFVKDHRESVGVGLGIVQDLVHRLVSQVVVDGRDEALAPVLEPRRLVDVERVVDDLLSDVGEGGDAALLEARNLCVRRQPGARDFLRRKNVPAVLQRHVPGSPHELRVDLLRWGYVED
mmetsp:Transcript_1928/g.5130  ORF Transcript_1928/g.5130 Transcript_1928/m.5130 type:complete len:253 (+) Transcript_1928:281-1039(+)